MEKDGRVVLENTSNNTSKGLTVATIFISYSRTDIDFVRFLEPRIQNIYGMDSVWYDRSREGIKGGELWWNRIATEIKLCRLFMFLISDESVKSEWCLRELKRAIIENKVVLPIFLETYKGGQAYPTNLRIDLNEIQFVDLRSEGNNRILYDDLSPLWGAINRAVVECLPYTDRWLLYNQYEILKLIQQLRGSYEDPDGYERVQKVIGSGYKLEYDSITSGFIFPEVESRVMEEVRSILRMYSAIEDACNQSSLYREMEKLERVDCSEIDSLFLEFSGFGANHETDHFSYVRYMLVDEKQYPECMPQNEAQLNSHMPMLPIYRRMLAAWHLSKDELGLTKEDIRRIAAAADSP